MSLHAITHSKGPAVVYEFFVLPLSSLLTYVLIVGAYSHGLDAVGQLGENVTNNKGLHRLLRKHLRQEALLLQGRKRWEKEEACIYLDPWLQYLVS